MAMIDVPFKTPQEMQEMVARLEAEFANRYTGEDPGYKQTVKDRRKYHNVPVMHPWPPPPVPRRRYNRDRGSRRYGHNYDNRGDNRGYHREMDRKRSRSPYHSSRHSPPSPYRSHYHSSPPWNHAHSRDHTHQSRDHARIPAYDSLNNEIPSLAPLDPHYDYTHPSSCDHTHSSRQPPLEPQVAVSSFTLEPLHRDSLTPPPPAAEWLERPRTPTGCVSTEESNPHAETDSEVDRKGFDVDNKLLQNVLGGLIDDTPKVTPTESDVTDILNMAHGGVTKRNLKQTATTNATTGKHKRGEKQIKRSLNKSSSSNTLQVTHGQSINVSSTVLFENPQREQVVVMNQSSGDSDVDVMSTDSKPSNISGHGYNSNGSSGPGQAKESLIVHIPKRLTSESSSNELDPFTIETQSPSSSRNKSSKKKKKKKKKLKGDMFTGSSTVIDDGSQVKIKLKLSK